jgi:hypothetical protein
MINTDSPISQEMARIMGDNNQQSNYEWTIEFKVKDTFEGEFDIREEDLRFIPDEEINNKIFIPLKITNIDFKDDYEHAIMREIWGEAIIQFGMWVKCLYPAHQYVEAILRRFPLKAISFDSDEEAEIEEFHYDVIFHLDESNTVQGVDLNVLSRTQLDNQYKPMVVKFELLDKSIEKVRKISIGGNYRNVKPEDFLKNIFVNFTKDVLDEGEPVINEVSVVEAHNKDKRNHIVIPQGMALLDVPTYVQDHCGGVYNSELSVYALNRKIYIFPRYQTDRFEEEQKTLTIYRIPTNYVAQIEKTFMVDGDSLFILGMSEAMFMDNTQIKQLSGGNGTRYADSRRFMHDFFETKDNKAMAKRKENNSEFKAFELQEQDYVPVSINRIHSNAFKERSKLAVRKGGSYLVQWVNSDPELIYPGMPCRILYEEKEEMMEMRGVILGSQTSFAMIGEGLTQSRYGTTTVLNIFAAPFTED